MSRILQRLLADQRGETTTNLLGFSVTWFVIFFVFMMNVQLGQLFHRRDVVDHAVTLAADSASKTYCAQGEDSTASEREALRVIDPVLLTAATNDGRTCTLRVHPSAVPSADPGATDLDVALDCAFDCKIPVAAQVMCKAGRVSFTSRLKTVALGCDGKRG